MATSDFIKQGEAISAAKTISAFDEKLSRSGGTMTGTINFSRDISANATTKGSLINITNSGLTGAIAFYRGNDSDGAGIGINAGGTTVIGGGESADAVFTNLATAADLTTDGVANAATSAERMIVASDQDIFLVSGAQTWANRKVAKLSTTGALSLATPLTVANGGSGSTSFTAYGVMLSGTTNTGALRSTAVQKSGALYATDGTTTPVFITLPVAQGGTGATSFTANSAIISGSSTTSALTTRGIATSVGTDTGSDSLITRGAVALVTTATFIIDSNAALQAWANNISGNDYSRILIKAGTWTLASTVSGGTSSYPMAVIDISDNRTKSVIGEAGSKIVINNTASGNNWICGIKGNVTGGFPNYNIYGHDYFFRNVNIQVTMSSGNGHGFSNCNNLSNCTGSGGGYDHISFLNCANLLNCTGTGGSGNGNSFSNCADLSNCRGGSGNYGFNNCANLFNCKGGGNYGFYNCRTGFGCRGTQSGCYMEQSSGNTYGWANNPNGGFNLNSAP